jgi:UPF0755 protein
VRADELELAWDDETDRGRHRHRRARRGGRSGGESRGRGGRTAIALLLSVVILGVLAGGVWYGFDKVSDFFAAPDYNSGGSGEVVVEVKKGQSAADIGKELETLDVVKSQKAFVDAAKSNARSREIQPGFYKLRKQMRAADALSLLLDRANRVVSKVTLPEGLTYKATLQKLAEGTRLPLADFEAAAKDPIALGIPDFWFNRFDGRQSAKSVEGFLWPDTYEFNPGITAEQVLKQIIGQFLKVAESINMVKTAEAKNISPFTALITASLVQAESGVPADDAKVARVVYNRLDKKMPLEFDSTTNYWRELNGQERKFNLNDQELLDPSNPYRTYGQTGLPPGPIGNPGRAALESSINPTPGNWLFFVRIDKAGNSAFTDNYAQHQKNIEEAKRNGAY